MNAAQAFQSAVNNSTLHTSQIVRISPNHFMVKSDSGNLYNVYVTEKNFSTALECDCRAAEFGNTCWHAVEVANRLHVTDPEIGNRYKCPSGYHIEYVRDNVPTE